MEYFKSNLIYLLKREGMSKAELERRVNLLEPIGESTISKYCKDNNNTEPRAVIVNAISKVFGVDVGDFMNEDMSKQIITVREQTVISVCKQLINETKRNVHNWEKFIWIDDGDKITNRSDDWFDEWIDVECKFKSKFINNLPSIEDLIAFSTNIDEIGQFVMIKFPESYESLKRYELYLIKEDGTMLECCGSHSECENSDSIICNNKFYEILKELYDVTSNYQREEVFYRYLNMKI